MTPEWIGEFAFGAVVMLALRGWVWFKPAVDYLLKLFASVEKQRDTLLDVYRAEVLPAITASTHGLSRMADVLERIVPILEQVSKSPPDRLAK